MGVFKALLVAKRLFRSWRRDCEALTTYQCPNTTGRCTEF
jgi:hypothetical protein